MTKSNILTMMALGAMLSVGGLMNTGSASAQAAICPPNTVCPPPAVGTQPPKVTPTPPAPSNQNGQTQTGNQDGQNQTGNMDWRKRHRHNTNDGNQVGQNQPGNFDMRHRHHRRFDHNNFGYSGVNIGVGIFLGGHHYGYYVSCGEAGSIVRASGFRHVRTLSCAPAPYHFLASKRGRTVDVAVTRRGRIIAVNRAN